MKKCPVCGARCFDDMAVCYGCLYDFSRQAPPLTHDDRLHETSRFFDAAVVPAEAIGDAEEACEPGCDFQRVDPPWFSPCVSGSHDFEKGRCETFMPIPMVTVVRRGSEEMGRLSEKDGSVALEVCILAGGRVLLSAR